jgi:hypothetical protein
MSDSTFADNLDVQQHAVSDSVTTSEASQAGFYFLNYTAADNVGGNSTRASAYTWVDDFSGHVFEIASLDVSANHQLDPSFERIITQLQGLPDCSAAAIIDVSASKFDNLFAFQTDSADLDDISSSDVSFGVISDGSMVFSDISFSEAQVFERAINTYFTNNQIKHDFVRHLAFDITGGYNGSDIFSNETELVNAVGDMDVSFSTGLNNVLAEKITEAVFRNKEEIDAAPSDSTYSLHRTAANLFTLNLNDTNRVIAVDGSGSVESLLTDMGNQTAGNAESAGPITCPLRFAVGDKIAIRINYFPRVDTFSHNSAPISNRSYKLFLNLN